MIEEAVKLNFFLSERIVIVPKHTLGMAKSRPVR
jgi:hypothetical protein